MFLNAKGERVLLHDMYKGANVFVVGSGRSITPRHIELLKSPGIVTASLNQGSHYIRPNIFYCSDLHEIPKSILEDPTISKFVPTYTYNKPIYEDKDTDRVIGDYPNVTQCIVKTKSFSREAYFSPDYLFRQKGPSENLTPFSAIILLSLLYKLGFRTVYLLGFDFSSESNRCTYFFDRGFVRKTGRGISKVRNTMKQLLDIQDEFKIFNCSPRSGLDFFEYKDFESAINDNKISIDADIYDNSSKERFRWYLDNRSKQGRGG